MAQSLRGLRMRAGGPDIIHLFFTDDSLFFMEANTASMNTLKIILGQYEEASRQMIHMPKSSIFFEKRVAP